MLQIPRKESSKSLAEMTPTGDEGDSLLGEVEDDEIILDSLDAFPEDSNADFGDLGDETVNQRLPSSVCSQFAPTSSNGNGQSKVKDAFERLADEGDDMSECERDQLAVLDNVRAFYDPEFLK